MERRSKARRALLALAAATVLDAGASARGEPLQPEACDSLKAEQSRLEGLGVGQDLRRGPEQAQRSLTPARLKEVERLITIIEQIQFRCPRPPSPAAPAEAKAKAGTPGAKSAGFTGEDEPGKSKPKAKPKAAADRATGTVAPAAAARSAGNASTKPAPKKRPVDAYVSPQDDAPARKAEPAPAQARPPTAAAAPSFKSGLEQ